MTAADRTAEAREWITRHREACVIPERCRVLHGDEAEVIAALIESGYLS